MKPIVLAEVIADVNTPLVRVDGGVCRSDEARCTRRIDEIRARNQWKQFEDYGISCRITLRITQREAVEIQHLPLAQTVIGKEKEHLVFDDWAAQLSAKLVAFEWWWLSLRESKKVAGIEYIIPEEFK